MYLNVSFKVIFYYLQYIFVKVLSTFNNISENSISVIALILSVNFIISKKTWIFVQIKKKNTRQMRFVLDKKFWISIEVWIGLIKFKTNPLNSIFKKQLSNC